MSESSLIRKLKLMLKSVTSQIAKQIIIMYILPTIFGQLIEYNMRQIFLEKLYTKFGGATSPRPCFKKSKLSIYLDEQLKVLENLFLLYVQVEDCRNMSNIGSRPLDFTLYTTFFKK